MDEHHVEVAERAELASPVAAHRHQGDPAGVAVGGLVEQLGQPLVGGLGVGAAESVAVQVGTLDERLASAHAGTRPDRTTGATGKTDSRGRRVRSDRRHRDYACGYGQGHRSSTGGERWAQPVRRGPDRRRRAHRALRGLRGAGIHRRVLWFLVKLVIVVALVALVAKLVFRRRS